MQIIESTGFGVRSAALTLEKPESSVTFVLIPMLHLASPEFYSDVRKRLEQCDRIFVEGVGGRRTSIITLSYRIAGKLRRSGLVDQGRGLDLSDLRERFVRTDIDGKQFSKGWRKISRRLRWFIYIFSPIVGIYIAIVGPRRAMGTHIEVEDLPSRDDVFADDQFNEAIVAARDRPLCAAITAFAMTHPETHQAIGICWGASHIPAVTEVLMHNMRFRITNSEWLMVMP